jgi:hypothetical protein
MNDMEDKRIDSLISRHLSRELDQYMGRAAERFAREPRSIPIRRAALPWRTWAGAALAASLVISWAIYSIPKRNPIVNKKGDDPVSPVAQPDSLEPLAEMVSWRTIDDGTVLMDDDRPARQVRRQVLQTVCWYDPKQQTTVELTVPREQVMLIGLNSY